MLVISCPYCGSSFKIQPSDEGRQARCGTCGEKFLVDVFVAAQGLKRPKRRKKITQAVGCSSVPSATTSIAVESDDFDFLRDASPPKIVGCTGSRSLFSGGRGTVVGTVISGLIELGIGYLILWLAFPQGLAALFGR